MVGPSSEVPASSFCVAAAASSGKTTWGTNVRTLRRYWDSRMARPRAATTMDERRSNYDGRQYLTLPMSNEPGVRTWFVQGYEEITRNEVRGWLDADAPSLDANQRASDFEERPRLLLRNKPLYRQC